jgi:hypothetical protein
MEPVIVKDIYSGHAPQLSLMSLKRRDTWPSKSAAIQAARKIYKRWDSRVLERWNEYGIRHLKASDHPQNDAESSENDRPVTLTSSKYQEVLYYLRPNALGKVPLKEGDAKENTAYDPLFHPDIIGSAYETSPFYRSEGPIAWKMTKHIRPSLLYVFGDNSPISTPETREGLLKRTGVGFGGSGGTNHSKVKGVVLKGAGHTAPLEMVVETASAIGPWLARALEQWQGDQFRIEQKWTNRSAEDRLKASAEWVPVLEGLLKPDEQKRSSRL